MGKPMTDRILNYIQALAKEKAAFLSFVSLLVVAAGFFIWGDATYKLPINILTGLGLIGYFWASFRVYDRLESKVTALEGGGAETKKIAEKLDEIILQGNVLYGRASNTQHEDIAVLSGEIERWLVLVHEYIALKYPQFSAVVSSPPGHTSFCPMNKELGHQMAKISGHVAGLKWVLSQSIPKNSTLV